MILDLCDYSSKRDLTTLKVIEPACGSGAFLVPLVERLIQSARAHGKDITSLRDALDAKDLQSTNVRASRAAARRALTDAGVDARTARRLADGWIQQGDFLLDPRANASADLVVGNPPYIRLEAIPPQVSAAYRKACPAMGGRSDIYVGFYELGLLSLKTKGLLGFICADRWMRNAYGATLRKLISREWAVETIVNMTGVSAFDQEVAAYPAITIIRRAPQTDGPLVVDTKDSFTASDAEEVLSSTKTSIDGPEGANFRAARLKSWFQGRAGWPQGSPDVLAAIADIESRLPTLEGTTTGTKVGIGLATGADRVFITDQPNAVEADRMLPLALVKDISDGELRWSGSYLINPWGHDGLVDLEHWPRMHRYLSEHRGTLAKRHTAKSGNWHRTIDRVVEGLTASSKLYLPDFKEALFPVIDRGETYPHHNLYWITSEKWDLEVLGGILLSDIANLFISAYSVRMRGGYLRFQAQYLRRICLPEIQHIDPKTEDLLRTSFRTRNREAATAAVLPYYGLSGVPI